LSGARIIPNPPVGDKGAGAMGTGEKLEENWRKFLDSDSISGIIKS
jgi:hypothetical protein